MGRGGGVNRLLRSTQGREAVGVLTETLPQGTIQNKKTSMR